jgi:hypothetical protein
MCKKNGESMDHLLLHCEVATRLWNYVFTLLGVELVTPRSFLDLLACWNRVGGRDMSKVICIMVPLCVTWRIWQERNTRTFEDKESSVDGMRKNMISMLHLWVLAHHRIEVSTIEEFLNMCFLYIP